MKSCWVLQNSIFKKPTLLFLLVNEFSHKWPIFCSFISAIDNFFHDYLYDSMYISKLRYSVIKT